MSEAVEVLRQFKGFSYFTEMSDIINRLEDHVASARMKTTPVIDFEKNESLKGLEGKFVPIFWSPVHFSKQAGTMGLLLDPAHPAFAHFPTEGHTDWQWWRLTTESKTLCIDSLYTEVTPLVECVDNFANNRRLANLFETNCLNGKLIMCSMDLLREQARSPEKKQLLHSLVEYMKSGAFNPAPHTSPDVIARFLTAGQSSSREKPESIY